MPRILGCEMEDKCRKNGVWEHYRAETVGRWAPKDEAGREHSWQGEQYVQSPKVRRKLKNEEEVAGGRDSSSVCDGWGLVGGAGVWLRGSWRPCWGPGSFLWWVSCRIMGTWYVLKDHSGCWGGDWLGSLTLSRREGMALWTGDNGNREKWMNSHF